MLDAIAPKGARHIKHVVGRVAMPQPREIDSDGASLGPLINGFVVGAYLLGVRGACFGVVAGHPSAG
jgi:hypothetical protein